MHAAFCQVRTGQTVGEALASIRRSPPQNRVIYFYVVDDDHKLQGVIPTRRLLLSELNTPLAEIMVRDVISIPHTSTILEACEFFVMHRLLAFPVVDDAGRMVGLVDVELYTDELEELDRVERQDDLFQLIGVHLAESQQASPLAAVRNRFPWLLTNISGGIMAAFLSGMFEAELQQVVALAMFIPVVLALSESVSMQSVSLSLQSLHGQRPTLGALWARLRRESLTGLLLGAASAATVALVAAVWLRDARVAFCLLAGITLGVAASASIGVLMPNVFRLGQRDPQVAAGPVALALSDLVTLLLYLNLARWTIGS
jgi:magnesium transporter